MYAYLDTFDLIAGILKLKLYNNVLMLTMVPKPYPYLIMCAISSLRNCCLSSVYMSNTAYCALQRIEKLLSVLQRHSGRIPRVTHSACVPHNVNDCFIGYGLSSGASVIRAAFLPWVVAQWLLVTAKLCLEVPTKTPHYKNQYHQQAQHGDPSLQAYPSRPYPSAFRASRKVQRREFPCISMVEGPLTT